MESWQFPWVYDCKSLTWWYLGACIRTKFLEKRRPLLLSQACQAKLGMTKRVRDGSITLDDYDAQSLEVARQVGTGLFMIRIDHLIYNDCVRNPLLNDLAIDFDDEPGNDSTARDPDQPNFLRLFHTCDGQCSRLWDSEEPAPSRYACRELWACEFWKVFLVDASSPWILENARRSTYKGGLRQVRPQFQGQLPWNVQRSLNMDDWLQKVWRSRQRQEHEETHWPKFEDHEVHSGTHHALHDRLYDGMHGFFSDKNMVIMICRSGRHRSVANAELWSNTLTRCGRRQHSVSLLHLSDLDFGRMICAGNCWECSKQSLRIFQAHHDQVEAECLRRVPVPDPVTGRWTRPRPEHAEGPAQPVKDPPDEEDNLPQTSKKQATSATATSAETSTSCGTLDELAQRLGSFHESARALASCLQKHDVTSKTDQCVIEAVKYTFHKLLGEVRDDRDQVTPQSQEGLCAEIKQNKQRCSRTAFLKENPCPCPEEPSETSVHQTSTETPSSQSSARIAEQVSRMTLASSSSCRYLSKNLQNGNTNSKCRRSLRQYWTCSTQRRRRRARFELFGCTLDLDQTVQAQTSCLLIWSSTVGTQRTPSGPKWRSMGKTVFTQCDPLEPWCTCQSNVCLDDVKRFYPRPISCLIVVHPYSLEPEDSVLSKQYAFLSCAKICVDDSRFSPDLHKDRRVTLNKKKQNEKSDSTAYITEIHQTMWSLLTRHYPARQNDHVYGDPGDRSEYDGSRTFFKDVRSWKERTTVNWRICNKIKEWICREWSKSLFSHTSHFRTMTLRDLLECVQSKRSYHKTWTWTTRWSSLPTRDTPRDGLNVRSIPRCAKQI